MSLEEVDNEKEKNRSNKGKHKPTPKEVIKELLQSSAVPEEIKKTVENVDFDGEFDVTKVATSMIKSLEPILPREIDLCSKSNDAFDRLLSGETDQPVDTNQPTEKEKEPALLEFCILTLKTIVNELPDLAELLLLKFKQPLIKCVLCEKLDNNIRVEASLVCERIMEKTKFFEDEIDGSGSKWMSVYLWVVKCAIREDATRCVIKRVWAMHKLLTMYSIPDDSPILELMKTTVTSPNFLLYKEGRQHIAHLLSLDKTRLVLLNAKIKAALPSLVEKSKSLATSYGEIFNMAWTQALPEVRQELEDQVFQRWMELYLKLDRPKYVHQTLIGKAIFRILSHLHNSRRLLQLSSAITRLYQPILWRALTSYNPLERCNAAELFLDVFPLEKPECNIVENSNLKEKQFRQIMELLHDECHFTRIVAIRGLVPVFKRRVDCLSNNQCREVLSWLANDLANDASSYLVRVAVWDFFSSLIQSENPIGCLTLLLPQMTNHFHDSSEQVRKAFVCMLLHIDASTDLNLLYTDVVPMSHIIARLSLENETVGKLLAKLIIKTIYTEGMEVVELVKRIKRLIMKCPKAAENLFRWSSHVLSPANANFVIVAILIYLRSFTKDRVEGRSDGSGKSTCKLPQEASESANKSDNSGVEDISSNMENISLVANQQLNASPSASPVKKKRKKSKRPSPEQPQQPDQGDAKEDEKFDIDGPTAEIHAHLLGCAHVTWIAFSKQFESHPKITSDLNAVLTVCLQNYLRCYKGTPAWYASVTLASMVPVTKLSENTTASSSCLAELRRADLTTPKAHIEALIYTLTAWNRGFEIMELAIDYIDPAFRLFQLNSSAFLTVRSGNRKGQFVRFAKDGGKEMIGLTLLDILFYDYHNETRLVLKQYDRIYELFHYLSSIKVVIEEKFGAGLSKESVGVLTDGFILKCFEIKLKLLTILDRAEPEEGSENPPFSSTQHMCSMIEWTTKVILPHLENVKIDETEENVEDDDEIEDEERDSDDEENRKTKKKTKKKKNEKVEPVKEDFVVSCLKAVLNRAVFMVKTKQTDKAHSHACANFALSLIKSDGKLWFIQSCFDLVESLADHTRAWFPKDEDQILSIVCPSLYSHILLAVTANTRLSQTLLRKYNCELSHLKRKLFTFPSILLAMYGTSHNNFTKVFNSIIDYCIAGVHSEAIKIETIEMVDKVEELSVGVCTVTQAMMSKPKLVPLILPAISDFIHDNKEDGVRAVCGVSYLYTVVETYQKKIEKEIVVQTIQNLYTTVSNLISKDPTEEVDADQQSQQEEEDSFFLDPLAKLDAKKLGVEILQNMADSFDCQLIKPVPPRVIVTPSVRRSYRQSLPRGI